MAEAGDLLRRGVRMAPAIEGGRIRLGLREHASSCTAVRRPHLKTPSAVERKGAQAARLRRPLGEEASGECSRTGIREGWGMVALARVSSRSR